MAVEIVLDDYLDPDEPTVPEILALPAGEEPQQAIRKAAADMRGGIREGQAAARAWRTTPRAMRSILRAPQRSTSCRLSAPRPR